LDSECSRYIDFKVISAAENSNKFPKTRLWKEKSFEQQGSKMGDNKPSYMMFDPYSQSETKHPPTSICLNAPNCALHACRVGGRNKMHGNGTCLDNEGKIMHALVSFSLVCVDPYEA
jgi:hypothetical protein